MALKALLQGRTARRLLVGSKDQLQCFRLLTTSDFVPPGINSRAEDRLHRVRSPDAAMQVNPSAALKLKLSRPQEPLTEEQRAILNALKRSTAALDWEAALGTLNQLPEDAGTQWLPIYRAILNCVCKALRYTEAHHVWMRLPARDVMSYNSMLGMCSRLQRFDEVDSLLRQMEAEGIERTGVTYCQVMSSCAESQRWGEALELLGELKSKPLLDASTNWEVAYLMSMTACARAGQTDQVRSLLQELKATGKGNVHNSHYNALIVSCGSNGLAAQQVFQEMKDAGLYPRAPDWRVLLTCNRDPKEQQRLYGLMRQELPQAPLEEAWAVLLRNAVTIDDMDAGEWVMQEMRNNGCDPTSERAQKTPSLRRALRFHGIKQQQAEARAAWQTSPLFGSMASPETQGTQGSMPGAPPVAVPLPTGWDSAVDPNTGRSYYWRTENPAGTTTWERPS